MHYYIIVLMTMIHSWYNTAGKSSVASSLPAYVLCYLGVWIYYCCIAEGGVLLRRGADS